MFLFHTGINIHRKYKDKIVFKKKRCSVSRKTKTAGGELNPASRRNSVVFFNTIGEHRLK